MAPARRVILGKSGLSVARLGLGASYRAPTRAHREAHDRGVNYFYWGSLRREMMAAAIREIAKRDRDALVVVVQSFARFPFWLRLSVERALRRLSLEHADVLLLCWHDRPPSPRLLDAARALIDTGRVRSLAVSTHNRGLVPRCSE